MALSHIYCNKFSFETFDVISVWLLLCYKSFKYCACQHYRSTDDTDAQRSDFLRSGRYISGLVNHQHLMLFLDFYLRWFQHHEELGNHFHHPLHTIVHHEVLLTWWWWLENSVNHYFIWKINSHLIQAIVVPRQSEHMLTSWAILLHLLAIELVGDFISLNSGICLKY